MEREISLSHLCPGALVYRFPGWPFDITDQASPWLLLIRAHLKADDFIWAVRAYHS
jgi:hypothetical protein